MRTINIDIKRRGDEHIRDGLGDGGGEREEQSSDHTHQEHDRHGKDVVKIEKEIRAGENECRHTEEEGEEEGGLMLPEFGRLEAPLDRRQRLLREEVEENRKENLTG